MQSPKISIHKACPAELQRSRGFALIEILIVLAVFGSMIAFGVVAGIDTLSRYNFHAELDNTMAILQKARSESINNIGGVAHGVHFPVPGAIDPDNLVLFNGSANEFKIAKNPTAVYTGTADIIFTQLSGRVSACATPCTVTISDGVRNNIITINYEGSIDY